MLLVMVHAAATGAAAAAPTVSLLQFLPMLPPLAPGWAAQVVAWGAMGAQHESGRKIGMEVVDGGHVKRD